jgi:hypothetical protein
MKEADLQLAVKAWRSMFGDQLPASFDELNDELFHQASEQANLVTLTVRRHGFDAFLAALKREPK